MEINQLDSDFKSLIQARMIPDPPGLMTNHARFESFGHDFLKIQGFNGTLDDTPKTDSALEVSPRVPKNKLWLAAPNCQRHGRKQEVFCETCQQLLCESCAILKDHLGHAIQDLFVCFDSLKGSLQHNLARLDASLLDRQQKMDNITAWLKDLDLYTSTQIQKASDVSRSDFIPLLEEQHGQFQNELQLKLKDLMLAQDQLSKIQNDIRVMLMDPNPYHLAQQFKGFKDSQAKIESAPSLQALAISREWKHVQSSSQGYILAAGQDLSASATRPNRHTDVLLSLSLTTPLPSFCSSIPVSVEYWITGYPKTKESVQMMPGTMIPICPCGSRGNSTGTLMIAAQNQVFEFPLHLLTL